MNTQQNIQPQKTKAREVNAFSSPLNLTAIQGGRRVCNKSYNFHS